MSDFSWTHLVALTISVSSVEFSQDSSLMGVGSSQSCIRLWSMKGEKLKAKTLGKWRVPRSLRCAEQ